MPLTALAARNELMATAGEAENIQPNFLAMVLDVNPPRNCIAKGGFCGFDITGCCKPCGCLAGVDSSSHGASDNVARNKIMAFSGEEDYNQATNDVNVLALVLDVDPPATASLKVGFVAVCVLLEELGVHNGTVCTIVTGMQCLLLPGQCLIEGGVFGIFVGRTRYGRSTCSFLVRWHYTGKAYGMYTEDKQTESIRLCEIREQNGQLSLSAA
ncbi:hypothetical protein V6N11_029685 [Hibiscus sabdariffa]|uniref:Uncharacterized protein n=1 Tax=Hibiscus sabdariffa TaxID=183260 RepID=A0ABR2P7E6_9ROSI